MRYIGSTTDPAPAASRGLSPLTGDVLFVRARLPLRHPVTSPPPSPAQCQGLAPARRAASGAQEPGPAGYLSPAALSRGPASPAARTAALPLHGDPKELMQRRGWGGWAWERPGAGAGGDGDLPGCEGPGESLRVSRQQGCPHGLGEAASGEQPQYRDTAGTALGARLNHLFG